MSTTHKLRWLLPALLITACAGEAPPVGYADDQRARGGAGKADWAALFASYGSYESEFVEPEVFQPACIPPVEADCLDVAFLESPCGQQSMDFCRDVAYRIADREASNVPHIPLRNPEGQIVQSGHSTVDPRTLSIHVWGDDDSALLATEATRVNATANGGLTANRLTERQRWVQNGRVESCAEYVHEKFLDHTNYEDDIAALGLDSRAAVAVTLANYPGLDNARDAMGNMLSQNVGRIPKNAYFETPADLLDDPRLFDIIEGGRAYYSDNLGSLAELDARFSAEPDTELDELYDRSLEYRGRLRERAGLNAELGHIAEAIRSGGCLADSVMVVVPLVDGEHIWPCEGGEMYPVDALHRALTQGDARLAALDDALRSELTQARADGCLEPSPHPCDWSPRRFVDVVRGRFDGARQAALMRCKRLIEDVEPEGLPDIAWRRFQFYDARFDAYNSLTNAERGALPHPSVLDLHGGEDYALNFDMVDRYMRRLEEMPGLQSAYDANVVWQAQQARREAEAKVAMDAAGLKRLGKRYTKTLDEGGAVFRFTLHYLFEWKVSELANSFCDMAASFEALFESSVTLFSAKVELLYARFFLDMDKYQGDLRVLGGSIVNYSKNESLTNGVPFNLVRGTAGPKSKRMSKDWYFVVLKIPMKATVGISGSVGMHYGASVEVDRDQSGDVCNDVSAKLTGTLTPFAHVKGFAELAVDLLVARAGVGGRVTILDVKLPTTMSAEVSAPGGDLDQLQLVLRAGMDLTLSALRGAIYLWGEIGWCDWCKRGSIDVFKWNGISQTYDVFDTSLTVPLAGARGYSAN